MNRDNIFWTLSMIGSLAVMVSTHLSLFPGLPDGAVHTITLIAAFYATFAGKMGNSPLRGKNDMP